MDLWVFYVAQAQRHHVNGGSPLPTHRQPTPTVYMCNDLPHLWRLRQGDASGVDRDTGTSVVAEVLGSGGVKVKTGEREIQQCVHCAP